MNITVLLLFKYGEFTAVLKVSNDTKYVNLLDFVYSRWINLQDTRIHLSYSIPGNSKCMLDNDDDFINLLSLAYSFKTDHIDVYVFEDNTISSVDSYHIDNVESNNEISLCQQRTEADLLAKYCPHREAVLLGSSWSKGICSVGDVFEGGVTEFRNVLTKYSIEVGFKFIYQKNDKKRVTTVCSLRASTGCLWRVHATLEGANGYFYIKTLENNHTCGAVLRTDKNPRVTSNLVGSLILNDVRDDPLTRPINVKKHMKKKYGLTISYNNAWYSVEKAKQEIYGDQTLSFDQLRWYVDEANKTNPGSHLQLDYDHDSKHFKRLFVAFHGCIEGFKFCRPMLFLDGTFLKARYKGNLLCATGKDANQQLFPLAYAVVTSENEDNWMWFCNELRKILVFDRIFTFISDRHPGLVNAIGSVFPECHHAFCLRHLTMNLKEKLGGVKKVFRDKMVQQLSEVAYAPTETAFLHHICKLRAEGGERIDRFLSDLSKEKWTNAYFKGQRYGEMYSNAAESFNSQIMEARHLPVADMVDRIRLQIMQQMTERRNRSTKWTATFCPEFQELWQKAVKDCRSWLVSQSSETIYEVHSHPSVLVDLALCTCSCYQWQLKCFPCSHVAAVLINSGKDIRDHVDSYFHVCSYQKSYEHPIYPVVTAAKPPPPPGTDDALVLPPKTKRQPGRPKKSRIPSRFEGGVVRKRKCGRCGTVGYHNKKTCKEPL